MKTAISDGTIDDILTECGYEQHDGKWIPPEVSVSEMSVVIAA